MNQLFYSLSDSTLRCYNKLPPLQHHSILTFFAEVNLRRSHIPLRTQPLSQIVQMPLKGSLFWLIPFFLFCKTVVVVWFWRMAINSEGGWRILQTSQKYYWPFDFRAINCLNYRWYHSKSELLQQPLHRLSAIFISKGTGSWN